MHVYGYRNPNHGQRGFFLAPLVGGLIGGFVGGAFGGAISRPYGGFPGPYGGYPGAFGAYPGAYGPLPSQLSNPIWLSILLIKMKSDKKTTSPYVMGLFFVDVFKGIRC